MILTARHPVSTPGFHDLPPSDNVHWVKMDFLDPSGINAAALDIINKMPLIDRLVMVAGVLQDQLLAFTSEEDEDGQLMADKIPDYILEHNLVFRDPFGITERSHIVIPMPYGLNMAVNIGRSLSRASRGGYTPAEAADSAMMTMIDTLNPLGGTESFINFVMPTVVDPIIDLYENEDFAFPAALTLAGVLDAIPVDAKLMASFSSRPTVKMNTTGDRTRCFHLGSLGMRT